MKWRVTDKFKNGMPWNGAVTGYKIVNGRYEIISGEAEIVRLIYELYLSGLGYEAIAKQLNQSGYATRNGKAWNHGSVLWILHNPAYTGNLLLQSTFTENHITKKWKKNKGEYPMYVVEGSHDAIIPPEIFNAVQEESKRRAEKYLHAENQQLSPFSGRVVCGSCGYHCMRKKRHNGYIWICSTYNNKGKDFCASKAVPERVLTAFAKEIGYENIERIAVCNNNILKFVLTDGTEITRQWEDRSRSESWTDEMKEKASQRRKEQWQEKRSPSSRQPSTEKRDN